MILSDINCTDIVNTITHFAKVYHVPTSVSLPIYPLKPMVDYLVENYGNADPIQFSFPL